MPSVSYDACVGDADEEWIEELPELVRAAAKGDLREVTILIERGVSAEQATADGWSALHAASARGHVEVVSALLQAGAPVDARASDGFTPLLNAAGPGTAAVVALLLEHGADPNVFGGTLSEAPLQRAADYGKPEIVQLLLAAGARVNEGDVGGLTALTAAAEQGNPETVALLIGAGADCRIEVNGEDAATLARKWGHDAVARAIDAAR